MNIYGLGHPRSGNTWVEYICGCFGVSNCIKAHGGASFPGHRGISNWNENYWMIFMVRDYKEAILRHQLFEEEATPEKVADIALNKEYAEGIEIYDSWPNKKIHIYYEDLITSKRIESFFMHPLYDYIKEETFGSGSINIKRLDDLYIPKFGLLKIDCERHELPILEGGIKTILEYTKTNKTDRN